ncbi:NB-ARC domain-containing protein, partial [Cladophialophora immunda]
MFRWYRNAVKCYVYLADVSIPDGEDPTQRTWERAFRSSRWFTRGWTLQELLAPASVEFFSREGQRLGSRSTLEQPIHEITDIPITALRGASLSQFSVDERMRWAARRHTKKKEDQAYCLLGIFDLFMPPIYGEGDHAFIRLNKELGRPTQSTNVERSNMHWVVPRSPNTLFTGRKDILDDLERRVRAAVQDGSRSNQCRVVIAGLGGQGKSEISLQLAQRVRWLLWGIFWIDVSTHSLAENGFLDVAHRLQISASTWEEGRQGLANIRQSWMMVLDNADDPNVDYQDYFPPGTSGVVVLTSRNAECEQYATAEYVALEGLPTAEATQLLLKAAGVAIDRRPLLDDDARRVAILLQSHPLALIQAGAYVKRGHCSLAAYPKVYERQRKRLLEFRPSQARSRYRDVYATFEASVEILQASQTESSQDALELLPLLAMCGPSQLPLLLFEAAWKGAQRIPAGPGTDQNELRLTAWHVSRLPSLLQAGDGAWDSFRLVEAVNALRAFALVSTNVENGHVLVSMHPLVHAWARDRQDEHQHHASWVAMGCIVAVSRSEDDMWRVHARQLQPHLQAITSWEMGCAFGSENQVAVCSIWTECGWLLHGTRDDQTLFGLLDRLCSHLGLDKRSVDQGWIEVYELVSRNLYNYGKVRDAVELLEEVVRIQEQTLAEDHPSRLASQHTLAIAYQANGQVKDAVELLEEVVRIKGQTLAEDHPDRLASQHELARAYRANGKVNDAVKLLEEVVRIRGQTLAEDHPSRLASQHELARAYRANGKV